MDKLDYYRKKIDVIDKSIAKLISLRFKLIKQISNYKKINKIDVIDKKREMQVLKNVKKCFNKKHKKFVINIFKNIINYSKKLQK